MSEVYDVEILLRDCHPESARIHFRVCSLAILPGDEITGVVSGPFSKYRTTLSAKYLLRPTAATSASTPQANSPQPADPHLPAETLHAESLLAETLLAKTLHAETLITDPCFWTPDTPLLYQLHLSHSRRGERIGEHVLNFGIRASSVRGEQLRQMNKPLVLRGIHVNQLDERTCSFLRETLATAIVWEPSDALLEHASDLGILLVVRLQGNQQGIELARKRLARCPAVVMTWEDDPCELTESRRSGQTLLRGVTMDGHSKTHLPQGYDVAIVKLPDEPEEGEYHPANLGPAGVPVIAYRPLAPLQSQSFARAACDQLQRILAGKREFCGYFV